MKALLDKPVFIGIVALSVGLRIAASAFTTLSPDISFLISTLDGQSKWSLSPFGILSSWIIQAWRNLPVDHPPLASWSRPGFEYTTGAHLLVAMIKLPLLVADVIVGLVIYRIARSFSPARRARAISLAWFLNPFVILLVEMWGAVDIVPTLLLLVGTYLAVTGRLTKAMTAIASGIALKLFPILVIPVVLAREKFTKQRAAVIAFAAAGLTVYFSWVWAAGYDPWFTIRQYDLFTQYIDEFAIQTATTEAKAFGGVRLGMVTLILIPAYVFVLERWRPDSAALLDGMIIPLLVFFALANWLPQYFIWVIPFLTLRLIHKENSSWVAALMAGALSVSVIGYWKALTSNGSSFLFIPVDGFTILTMLGNSYLAFSSSKLVSFVLLPSVRALFTALCILYLLKVVQDDTEFLSDLVGRLRLKGR